MAVINIKTIREISEDNEKLILSNKAVLSSNSKGRKEKETDCEIRTAFQRDRDRIIHCKSFRRLKHKTQVFLSPELDHYRTRLTHTLEVSQIARTIARAIRVNEDLTEAIALGHDLGHTPFGHEGERTLNLLSSNGFTHYEQSVRVVEKLEKGGKGLNLTYEVIDGILHHTCGDMAETLEGRIVRVADRIAFLNHDLDDAIRANVLTEKDIPEIIVNKLGNTKSERINTLVMSVVKNSTDDITMDKETQIYFDMLYNFLFERVYLNHTAKAEESKVFSLVEGLFKYFIKNPDKMSEEYQKICEQEGKERAVLDYIAGMTDHYAISKYSDIYIPKSFNI